MELQTFEVGALYDGERLDKFLATIYPSQSRTFFQKLIKEGQVTVKWDVAPKRAISDCSRTILSPCVFHLRYRLKYCRRTFRLTASDTRMRMSLW